MKFSVAWLREWVDPALDTQGVADQLTMAGLEVDAVEAVAGSFKGVVVGYVVERVQHPDADKLSLCTVDTGAGETTQIVCGAANVAAGLKVAVAEVGAVLPGNFKIKRAKLRGVESLGMICSASELGLADSSDGIMELPSDAPVGTDIREYLKLDDETIDVDLTPDRGDCLGLAGIAREVGVINRIPVTPQKSEAVPIVLEDVFPVTLDAPEQCPRYLCRVVRGIDAQAESPLWLQEKLRRSGLRSISPVVDVTNYVMLELGQPMHAFDLEKLDGGIRVRMATSGEKLVLLDGVELELRDDTLVIADEKHALAVAGIMGGSDSGVTGQTRDILFESAFFAPLAVVGKARSYGLHTESSHRFERGVDPQLQASAMERATGLLLEIAGGKAGPVNEQLAQEYLPVRQWIVLRRAQITRLLGLEIADDRVADILLRLDMQVESVADGWRVRAPGCRFDVSIEADLIEEIGRIYGYSEIPMTHGAVATVMRGKVETEFDLDRAKDLLVGRDFQEAITYSFISSELHELLDSGHADIQLANPISADMASMRTSLWPGLLQALGYNRARQQARIRFFESGLRFVRENGELQQEPMLAAVVTGPAVAEQWGSNARQVDFFDLKSDLQALLALTGEAETYRFVAEAHPSLHPGQSARIYKGDLAVGRIGMLHPQIEEQLDLGGPVYLFEIRLDAVLKGALPKFSAPSKFPSTRRDIALVVDESIASESITACIKRSAPDFLRDILIFDVYNGEKVEVGRKSLALGLIFQETQGSLNDAQVEDGVSRILRALTDELNAQLRE